MIFFCPCFDTEQGSLGTCGLMHLKPFIKGKNKNRFPLSLVLVVEQFGDLPVFFQLARGSQELNLTRKGEWK